MKYLKAMFAGAALLAGSLAFGGNQDAVALTDSQMDQVTGEYVLIFIDWDGSNYHDTVYEYPEGGGRHTYGTVYYRGGPLGGILYSFRM
ncbi:MAG: hypothetical protein IPL39_14160 [Opitutaceae bacterium]|nr:hypothetical protein [Opitutaceae bacterium]